MNQNLFGVGIYSVAEASRLTRVPPDSIRNWLWGYHYSKRGKIRSAAPLWTPQLPLLDDSKALGFRDLIEVQFIHTFRQHGVSLQTIRRALGFAMQELEGDYPFSSLQFKSDGKSILAEVVDDPEERRRIFDVITGQFLLEIFFDRLYEGLEYSKVEGLVRWWPLGKDREVVLDPKRNFGQPITSREGVPTAILEKAYRTEGSIHAVAEWYEVAPHAVEDALELERKLAA